ncbi:TPA: Rha family transcriptional regulator [Salmonella enterica subsp. diarizonae serovar 53:z10:z35]
MRFSEIAAIHLHSFNKVLISGSHTQWKLIHLDPDFLVVVLNSVVHDSKHNKIVMLMQALDHLISGRYTVPAPYKTGVGCRNPESNVAHNRAFAVFLCVKHGHIRIMVGRAGQPQGWPGSTLTGIPTPACLTTNQTVGSLGGELSKLNVEAAIMATIPALAHPEITIINGQAVTSSQAIADYFTKRHDDVLKKIRALECSPEFSARNFAGAEYTDDQGKKRPCYQITRDGFAFLAMGFTGKRAAQFKEAYINAFNQMESRIRHSRSRYRMLMTFQDDALVEVTPIAWDEMIFSPRQLASIVRDNPQLFDDRHLWELVQTCMSHLKPIMEG